MLIIIMEYIKDAFIYSSAIGAIFGMAIYGFLIYNDYATRSAGIDLLKITLLGIIFGGILGFLAGVFIMALFILIILGMITIFPLLIVFCNLYKQYLFRQI